MGVVRDAIFALFLMSQELYEASERSENDWGEGLKTRLLKALEAIMENGNDEEVDDMLRGDAEAVRDALLAAPVQSVEGDPSPGAWSP